MVLGGGRLSPQFYTEVMFFTPAIIYDSVEDDGDAHIAEAPCPDGPSVIVYQPTNRILSSIAGLFNCANFNGLPPTRRRRK